MIRPHSRLEPHQPKLTFDRLKETTLNVVMMHPGVQRVEESLVTNIHYGPNDLHLTIRLLSSENLLFTFELLLHFCTLFLHWFAFVYFKKIDVFSLSFRDSMLFDRLSYLLLSVIHFTLIIWISDLEILDQICNLK